MSLGGLGQSRLTFGGRLLHHAVECRSRFGSLTLRDSYRRVRLRQSCARPLLALGETRGRRRDL